MFRKFLTSIAVIWTTVSGAEAVISSIDYDDLREFQNFNNRKLTKVTQILRSESSSLTAQELDDLVKSKDFVKLKRLDLSGNQNLTDEHIQELCNNSAFKRLLDIDLSNCKNITQASLQAILSSPLGSIRDLPQISDQYGCPSTQIRVSVGGKTGITLKEKKLDYILRPFAIQYQPSNGRESSFSPVKNGLKMLEIEY